MYEFFEETFPKHKKLIVSLFGKSGIKPGAKIPGFNMDYNVYSLEWMYFLVQLIDMQCLKTEVDGTLSVTRPGADWLKTQ